MNKYHLMTPGPTEIPPSVLAESCLPILHHRSVEFRSILAEVSQNLKKVFYTQQEILIFSAGATGAMEACVVNLSDPEETILVVSAGVFGERWAKIAENFQRKVIKIEVPWGQPINPCDVAQKLREHPEIVMVAATLCETSTGVDHPIDEIGQITRGKKTLLVVDVVSGLCVSKFKMDEWSIDAAVAGSQKGLMCPPGLSLIALSVKAKNILKIKRGPKFFWSFEQALALIEKEGLPDTPFTPNVSLIVQLKNALKLILNEGMENIWKRHKLLAEATRAGITGMGLELFAKEGYSAGVTTIYSPQCLKSSEIINRMHLEWGIIIVGGQGKIKNEIFRIGHMGFCYRSDILMILAVLEIVLKNLGIQVTLGAGVRAAQEFFILNGGHSDV